MTHRVPPDEAAASGRQGVSPGAAKSPVSAREQRLKAALKANLARRKAQSRARAGAQDAAQDQSAQGAAGDE